MEAEGKRRPHVLAVPIPAEGHVRPLMKLCRTIADRGIKVTFVNTEVIHARLLPAMSEEDKEQNPIQLFSIPDGVPPGVDRSRISVTEIFNQLTETLPRNLTCLMEKINSENSDENISCAIVDIGILGCVHEIIQEMGVESVAFQPAAAANLAIVIQIPKLLQQGKLDINGCSTKNELCLSDEIPPWGRNELPWFQEGLFKKFLVAEQVPRNVKWILSNTFYELESSACNLIPNFRPIGPLLGDNNSESCASVRGSWVEDSSCLSWLHKQPIGSVIYVSFGSIAIFSQDQLHELALGLELSGQPFLWVIRSNLADGSNFEYPNGFVERVADRGKVIEWAPQEKVLAHSSIGCFLSHCGWNSTIEGLSMGVPFLCWPYFMDQFHNQNYICDRWKIGFRLNPNEDGIRSKHEIKSKIEMLLSDDGIKANALKLKEMAITACESGSSFQNLELFLDHL